MREREREYSISTDSDSSYDSFYSLYKGSSPRQKTDIIDLKFEDHNGLVQAIKLVARQVSVEAVNHVLQANRASIQGIQSITLAELRNLKMKPRRFRNRRVFRDRHRDSDQGDGPNNNRSEQEFAVSSSLTSIPSPYSFLNQFYMPALQEISICCCKVSEADIESLLRGSVEIDDEVRKWTNFKKLNIVNVGLNQRCMRVLAKNAWTNLVCLHLGDNKIGNLGTRQLVKCFFPNLESLWLNNCNLSSGCAQFVIKSSWPLLRSLNLQNNSISSAELAHILQGNYWPHLKQIKNRWESQSFLEEKVWKGDKIFNLYVVKSNWSSLILLHINGLSVRLPRPRLRQMEEEVEVEMEVEMEVGMEVGMEENQMEPEDAERSRERERSISSDSSLSVGFERRRGRNRNINQIIKQSIQQMFVKTNPRRMLRPPFRVDPRI